MDELAALAPAQAAPCPNCGASAGRFCPGCGQDQRHDLRRPVRRLLAELAEETLSLDGKLLRTVPALLLHPGRVAAELAAGRRARYTSPLRLYLGASLALFLAAAVGPSGEGQRFVIFDVFGGGRITFTPQGRGPSEGEVAALEALRARGGVRAIYADHLEHLVRLPPGEVARRYGAALTEDTPKALFLLVPLLALLLKAANRRRYYAESLVLALHAQTVGCLALVPHALTGWAPAGWAGGAASFAWFAIALRRLDGRGWGRTALAVAGVGTAYGIALVLVITIVSTVALLAV
jgi:hypothetical protein